MPWSLFFFLLCILLFFCIGFICTTLYWYEALNTPCKKLPHPPASLRACLATLIRNTFTVTAVMLTLPFRFIPLKASTNNLATELPPILLIHGLYHNAWTWIYLKPQIERLNFPAAAFQYNSFFSSLDSIVERLELAVQELEQQYHGQKPILVGHSLGGILIRKWLLLPGNEARIQGVITLGTPHGGSKLASLGAGPLAQAITPTSPHIKDLQKRHTPPHIPCISLCSPTDEAVLPTRALLPPSGWQMVVLRPCGHFGMLLRSSVARTVLNHLVNITKHTK